jgi:hypothetical protein
MLVSNYKVFITKNDDRAITYTCNNTNYKVFISKENEVLKEIFDKYYNLLKPFKERHYAIAKWIVRDIRAEGYVFRCYSNNFHNIRPIKQFSPLQKKIINDWTMDKVLRKRYRIEVSEFERLLH